jgi:hypothetical protein
VKTLIKQIEEKGLKVTHQNKRYLWVKAKGIIIQVDSYDLFGLEEDDLGLRLKQRFYNYNVKIDLYNPDNNRDKGDDKPKQITSVKEKKEKIRKLLKNKYKLLP